MSTHSMSPPMHKGIDDILKQLESVALEDKVKEPQDHDVGMAKLHALLTEKNSFKAAKLNYAAFKALSSKKYYRRATEIYNRLNSKDIFPFLALPAEIRLIVYQELLVSDDRLVVNWRGPKKVDKQQKKMHIAILLTCKLCANEGAGVLYGENVFDFQDIRTRVPIVKPLMKRTGATNLSFIRIVVCEWSAATEELSDIFRSGSVAPRFWSASSEAHEVDLAYVINFFKDLNIDLDKLRVFGISMIPYGSDDASKTIMQMQDPILEASSMEYERDEWLKRKNEGIGRLVEKICEREVRVRKIAFLADVDKKVGFDWEPPFSGRHWIGYVKGHKIES